MTMAQQAGAALMFEVNPGGDDMVVPCHSLGHSFGEHGDFYDMLSKIGGTATADKKAFASQASHAAAGFGSRSEVAIVADCQEEDGLAAESDDTWNLFAAQAMLPFGDEDNEDEDGEDGEDEEDDEAVLPHTPPRSPLADHYSDGYSSSFDHHSSRVPDLKIEIPPLNTAGMPALSAEMMNDGDDAAHSRVQAPRCHATRSATAPALGAGTSRSARTQSKPARHAKAAKAAKASSSRAHSLLKSGAVPKILPAGHKPARGRGRQIQLARMTAAQRKAEADFRLEKNRQAARDFRLRRKNQVQVLEEQVTVYAERDQAQLAQIAQLEAEVARLRAAMRA